MEACEYEAGAPKHRKQRLLVQTDGGLDHFALMHQCTLLCVLKHFDFGKVVCKEIEMVGEFEEWDK
jgi:hypothetical protein